MSRSELRRSGHVSFYLACALLSLLCADSLLRAQGAASTIVGNVTDPSGGAVAGATITITNTNTGVTRTVETDGTGNFSAPDLDVGRYTVTAACKGFKTGERTAIRLEYQQTQRADFVLVLGNVAESITVAAGATPIQTDEASAATVVSERQVLDLPLNGRNFVQLTQLVPGTTEGSPGEGNTAFVGTGFAVSVYGQRDFNNQYTLDGVDMTESRNPSPLFLPSVDAIQEFDVKSGLYSAQYGWKAGAHVDIAVKSGTNAFHGSGYEFVRNWDMDARNFFASTVDPLRRNQFGGTIGGPIWKNKLFFFGAYDGTRQIENYTEISVVPTPAEVGGDFSALTTPIINPATGTQFPGNKITNIDPNAKILNTFWPTPNYSNGPLNYIQSSNSFDNNNQEFARIDYNISEKDRIFGRFAESTRKFGDPASIAQFTDVDPIIANNVAFQEIHIFTPHVINSLLIGSSYYHREYADENIYKSVAEQLTVPKTHDIPLLESIPWLNIVGYATIGDMSFSPLIFHNQSIQIMDNLSFQKGKHSITLGGSIEKFRFEQTFLAWPRGYFDFEGVFTGNSFADYLLGLPQDTDVSHNLTPGHLFDTPSSIYVQDDWKLAPNLTVNAGLRYEVSPPFHDSHGLARNFNLATGQGFPSSNISVPLWNTDYGDIAPRLSFAYRPFHNDRTVIRGGGGLFYSTPEGNVWADANLNPPLAQISTYLAEPGLPLTFENPYPTSTLVPAGLPSFLADDLRFLNARTYLWSLDVQHMLSGNILLDVGYTGSRTVHLVDNSRPNQPLPGPGNPLLRLPYPKAGSIEYFTPNAFATYEGLAIKVEKRMSNGLFFLASYTYSQALDMGYSPIFGDSYDGGVQNAHDLFAEKGLADSDQKNRLSFSYGYELPFGKGKRFASHMSRPEEYLLGGWQINGIVTVESGPPFTVGTPGDIANVNFDSAERPNRIANGNLPSSQRTLAKWFDTSAFVDPQPYTFGNSGRDVLIGPGLGNMDLSLFKNLDFEKFRVQLRGEAFNVFNHANFNVPGLTLGTSTFGVISSAKPPRLLQVGIKINF